MRSPDSAYKIYVPSAGFRARDPFGAEFGGLLWIMDDIKARFQPIAVYQQYRTDVIRVLKSWHRYSLRQAEADPSLAQSIVPTSPPIKRSAVATVENKGQFIGPLPPSDWAKLFGVTWETVKSWISEGKVRAKKISSRAWLVHQDDLPKQSSL